MIESGKARTSSNSSLNFLRDDDGLNSYLREIAKNKVLTYKEERELVVGMCRGDKQAFKALITANLRFVVSVCRKYQHQGLPLTELISEGNLGLMRAAQSFDETQSCRFISYAVWWIRQRILQALAEQSRCFSIPVGRSALMRRMIRVRKSLEQKLGREVSTAEVAEALSLKEKDVQDLIQVGTNSVSLSMPVYGTEDVTLGESIVDESSNTPEEAYALNRRNIRVREILSGLKDLEKQVISLYFGFENDNSLTLEEISFRLDVSPERIRQIKDSALGRLRHPSRMEKLREAA